MVKLWTDARGRLFGIGDTVVATSGSYTNARLIGGTVEDIKFHHPNGMRIMTTPHPSSTLLVPFVKQEQPQASAWTIIKVHECWDQNGEVTGALETLIEIKNPWLLLLVERSGNAFIGLARDLFHSEDTE